MNEFGDIWVPRTVPYLAARKVARTGMDVWDDRLVYVGKEDAELLGFARDCRCDEHCELRDRCVTCTHYHGDYTGPCFEDECSCLAFEEPPAACSVPAWHFRSEVSR